MGVSLTQKPWIFADLDDLIDGTYEMEVNADDHK